MKNTYKLILKHFKNTLKTLQKHFKNTSNKNTLKTLQKHFKTLHFVFTFSKNCKLFIYTGLSNKAKPLTKMRGHILTSIGFNKDGTTTSTKPILIGTSKGLLFESEIELQESGFFGGAKEDKYFKQVYAFDFNQDICGIEIENFPSEDIDGMYVHVHV